MPNLTVKCVECGKRDTPKEFMENVGTEKTKKWCHPQCVDAWRKAESAKGGEWLDWCDLYETIKRIHGFQVLTQPMINTLKSLRNGTYHNKDKNKNQKKGVLYPIVKEAYMMSLRDIEYYKATRKFDSDIKEFNYCITIVVGNINEAYKKQKQKKVEDIKIRAHANNAIVEEVGRNTPVYKRKQYEDDISDLLD